MADKVRVVPYPSRRLPRAPALASRSHQHNSPHPYPHTPSPPRPPSPQSTLHLESCSNHCLHYAHTLRLWRQRFNAASETVALLGFDVQFVRVWNLYLCMCEASFQASTINLQQLTFSRMSNGNLSLPPLAAPEAR